MGREITGWDKVTIGATSDPIHPKGSGYSVARFIELVLELKVLLQGINPETISQLNGILTTLNAHISNTTVSHLTPELRAIFVEIVNAYQAGTLGGGGTGGGALSVPNRITLLATTNALHGTIAIVENEGTNIYIWNGETSKWAVKDGNYYLEIDMPSDTDFEIIPGTELINSTTGERFTWCVDLPVPPVPPEPEDPIPPVITTLAINQTGEQLTITTDIPSYNGAGYTDANFSLSGVLSGSNIGITYVSGSGTVTRIYTINSKIYQNDTVTLNYSSSINSVVAADGGEMESVTMVVMTNESTEELVEQYYSELNWPCRDELENSWTVVCSEDPLYNAVLTDSSATLYTQVYEHSELYGYIDYGFTVADNATAPSSIKVPKIVPTGQTITGFEFTAGYRWYDQSLHNCDLVLMHMSNAADTSNIRLEWNIYLSTYRLYVNGVLQTISNSAYVPISDEAPGRSYLKIRVTATLATLTLVKVTRDLSTGQTTEYFNSVIGTWNITFPGYTNPVLRIGGHESIPMDAYYNLTVGSCNLVLL